MRSMTNARLVMLLGASIALALVLGACYPNQPEDLADIGVAITINNPDGDYNGMLYWAMRDTVTPMIDPLDDSSLPLPREYDDLILEGIAQNMADRGFIRVFDPSFADGDTFPDVVIEVGAVQSDAWVGFIYYGGYGGYYGYGWGYPSTGYYKYTQGTVMWGMADWRGIAEEDLGDPDIVTPVLWAAALNGAISGATTGDPSKDIPNGVDQCFTQSTYIQATSR